MGTNTGLKIGVGFIGVFLFIWALPKFIDYYTTAPVEMLAGFALGALVYAPTLIFLKYMMRKKEVSPYLFWGVPLSVIFFFGPITSRTNAFFSSYGIPDYLYVGFSEETWKIMPLILILLFASSQVKSVRYGILYGALGGFGFACLEMGAYFVFIDFPKTGWDGFFVNSLSRATLLGTDLHIVWSAFLGGAIVYGLKSVTKIQNILIPLSAFILVVFTHGLQDKFGKLLAVLPIALLEPLFTLLGATEENLSAFLIPLLMFAATVNLLLVNIIILPLLLWMFKHDKS